MRTLLLALGLILMTVAVGAGVGDSNSAPSPPAREWVRTVDGWEPLRALSTPSRSQHRSLHPAVVAGVQLLASLGVLVAASPER